MDSLLVVAYGIAAMAAIGLVNSLYQTCMLRRMTQNQEFAKDLVDKVMKQLGPSCMGLPSTSGTGGQYPFVNVDSIITPVDATAEDYAKFVEEGCEGCKSAATFKED